ncbi:lipopolysaccharide biosynthesis protein [Weissella confusa]|uniref:lipopolysaccharide biosynthesis protein n=1 Tax=Weissella confusa TaxID=1583 RepID=UPI0022E4A3FD|nr:polysaccharide biosynthesis C-terminal domain-containing protein [Weissella confusa]
MVRSNKVFRLLSNVMTFALGGVGTKIITFLLVPLYTRLLSTTEYGTIDIIFNLITAVIPIVSLSIFDAVFRFSLDGQMSKERLFSNGLFITLIGSVGSIGLGTIMSLTFNVKYAFLFGVLLSLNAITSLFLNFIRGIGQVKTFSASGFISAITGAMLNIFVLAYLGMGVSGYLMASIVNAIIISVFLWLFCGLHRYVFISVIQLSDIKRLLKYSTPLIPNSFAWWFTLAASRYFILFFVGVGATGIFAVANKVPSLLNMLFGFFSQAWQISAVKTKSDADASEFYSSVFNNSVRFMFVVISVLSLLSESIVRTFLASNYLEAWRVIPILLLATLFSNMSGLLGTTYLAYKDTKMIMVTTVIGMILNGILNLIFVPLFGLNGAGFGSAVGFGAVMLIRLIDTRRYKPVKTSAAVWMVNVTAFAILTYGLLTSAISFVILTGLVVFIGIYNLYPIVRVIVKKRDVVNATMPLEEN